jgi:hypothetical protein
MTSVCVVAFMLLSLGAYRHGNDAYAYWHAWRADMYTTGPMTGGAYLYSPAFAHSIWPLAQLPWSAFMVLSMLVGGIGLAWLLSPLGLKWGIPLWMAGLPEITTGNIFIPLAVMSVVGFVRPGVWAFAALTKVSVCVGPVWFLVRREWGSLLKVIGVTVAAVVVSAAIAPGLWWEWTQLLLGHLEDSSRPLGSQVIPPLLVRFPIGIAVVIWGALTDRRWSVAVAMLLCSPVFWYGSLTLLAAIPRLRGGSPPAPVDGSAPPSSAAGSRHREVELGGP